MKDFYYLLGLLVALPLLLSSVGAAEVTTELCSDIAEVLEDAVERGEMSNKEAGAIVAACNNKAG